MRTKPLSKSTEENLPNLSGRFISLNIRDSDYVHELYEPYFARQGGVLFIVGTVANKPVNDEPSSTTIGAVNWSQVVSYTILNDIKRAAAPLRSLNSSENHLPRTKQRATTHSVRQLEYLTKRNAVVKKRGKRVAIR